VSKISFSIWIWALSGMLVACSTDGLSDRRAKEGHGLLARPSALSVVPRGAVSSYSFHQESPDVYSRVLFETDEAPDFRFQVREFCLPPHAGPATIQVDGDALLEMRTDRGTLVIGNQEQQWKPATSLMVPARAPVRLANPTDRELIVRLHILEGK